MSLQPNIKSAFDFVIDKIKEVGNRIGVLTALTTAEKTSIVGAINELQTEVNQAGTGYIAAVQAVQSELDLTQDKLGDLDFDYLSAVTSRWNAN
jgi:hypothetical protein